MKKLTMLCAGGVGYVLGAKAGRTRYEQLRQGLRRVTRNEQVRSAAHHAQETVQDKAPAVKEKVAAVADKVRPHHGNHAAGAASSNGWPEDPALTDETAPGFPPPGMG